jgi:hypothetical protein
MGGVDVIFLAIGGEERQLPWLLWRVYLIVFNTDRPNYILLLDTAMTPRIDHKHPQKGQ